MIEVETKVRVSNPDFWRRRLRQIGKYAGFEKKFDDYYTLQRKGYPLRSLRIRHQRGFYEVNFKHRLSYERGVFAKKEVEFKVSDVNGFIALIKDFGYKKWLSKEKHCSIFQVGRNFHVELNFVRGLGWFLEIEYLVDKMSEVEHARNEVNRIIKELGFREKDVVKDGYTKMLWMKMKK
jgi:predicted adenylyl cyclase CyaB